MKSFTLFAIGLILFGYAYKVNSDLNAQEAQNLRVNDAVSQFQLTMGFDQHENRRQERKIEKQDRTSVYVLCGLGGVSMLAGIATMGGKSR